MEMAAFFNLLPFMPPPLSHIILIRVTKFWRNAFSTEDTNLEHIGLGRGIAQHVAEFGNSKGMTPVDHGFMHTH